MTTFGELIIKTLEIFGFYRVILPFILIWILLYAILKPAFEKNEATKDYASSLASLIGFASASLIVYYAYAVKFIQYFVTFIALFFAFFVIGLSLFLFIYPQKKMGNLMENLVKHSAFYGAILIVVLLLAITAISLTLMPTQTAQEQSSTATVTNQTTIPNLYLIYLLFQNPGVLGAIFLLIISAMMLWAFTYEKKEKK